MKIFQDRLGAKLNILFLIVLFLPLIVVTVLSIIYFSNKIEEEAVLKMESDMKVASLIYDVQLSEVKNLAKTIGTDRAFAVLFPLKLSKKMGRELQKLEDQNNVDMILAIDKNFKVMARSNDPERFGDELTHPLVELALKGLVISETESVSPSTVQAEGIQTGDVEHNWLFLTGVAPIYDRTGKSVLGAILVRKSLNRDTEFVSEIHSMTNVDVGVFERTHLISSTPGSQLPSVATPIQKRQVRLESGGFISMFQPIFDASRQPIGSLLLRTEGQHLQARNTAILFLVVIGGVGLFLINFIRLYIRKTILVPIEKINKGAKVIGDGMYNHKLNIESGDEIGDLAQSFNDMADEIKLNLEKVKHAARMEAELKTAHTVQEFFIPSQPPELDGVDIASFYQSASETGGDWYAFNPRGDTSRLDIMVGDVTGHGVASALITAMVYSCFETISTYYHAMRHIGIEEAHLLHPSYVLRILNDLIFAATKGQFTMTLFFSSLDLKTRELFFINASHIPCYIWRKQGFSNGERLAPTLPRSGTLGLHQEKEFQMETMQLEPGDVLIWMSDGLIENMNPQKKMFGLNRFKWMIRDLDGMGAEEIKDMIIQRVFDFYAGEEMEDDVTLIVAKLAETMEPTKLV